MVARVGRYMVSTHWSGWKVCALGWWVGFRFLKVYLGPWAVSVSRA